MSFAEQIRHHQSRCHPHLRRLWLVAQGEASTLASATIAAEVRDATNAILGEAEAAVRAALASAAEGRGEPVTETFLWARLVRLADAADEAVSAAREGRIPSLRSGLRRFDELTSAIWTVQLAVYGQVTLPRPRVLLEPGLQRPHRRSASTGRLVPRQGADGGGEVVGGAVDAFRERA